MSNIHDIQKLASSLSKFVDDNEKMSLHVFSSKLSSISEAYPEDHTIGMMGNIVGKMLSSNKLFITKAEVRELYNKLYSRNTKFNEFFKDELGEMNKLAGPQLYNRFNMSESDVNFDGADPILAASLNNAFGNSKKTYSDVAAKNAENVCIRALAGFHSKVEVVNGNEDIVVCLASFDTPKGITNVYIPVEIAKNANVFAPSMFIGNSGVEELNAANIKSYILAQAGNKLNVTSDIVITATTKTVDTLSDVDLALTKLNATKEQASSTDYILGQNLDKDVVKDVVMPEYKDPEVLSFAKSLESAAGFAAFKFTAAKVKICKEVIARKLNEFGLSEHQISVYDSDDNSISYAVSLNSKAAFKVPVKIENGNVITPSIMISNGSVEKFSKDGIKNLFTKNAIDYKIAAAASPIYDLKASELVEIVRQAASEENHAKAEDALNVLMQMGDDKAYQTAFAAYSNGLIGKVAEAKSCCNFIVKNATSSHPICGHTNLPLHKVYQDKFGNCRPQYRQGMDETYEGAYFSNSKIFI